MSIPQRAHANYKSMVKESDHVNKEYDYPCQVLQSEIPKVFALYLNVRFGGLMHEKNNLLK